MQETGIWLRQFIFEVGELEVYQKFIYLLAVFTTKLPLDISGGLVEDPSNLSVVQAFFALVLENNSEVPLEDVVPE